MGAITGTRNIAISSAIWRVYTRGQFYDFNIHNNQSRSCVLELAYNFYDNRYRVTPAFINTHVIMDGLFNYQTRTLNTNVT